MLAAFRRGSKNIFVKAFLCLLAVTFVAWGVGDVLRGRTDNSIATLGGYEISQQEFGRIYQAEISRYQNILGRSLNEGEVNLLKFQIIEFIIERELFRIRAEDLDIAVGNDTVKKQIARDSIFHDESGKFSKASFDSVLARNGLSEASYIQEIKSKTAVDLLTDSISLTPLYIKEEAKNLYEYRNEKRIADIIKINADHIKSVPEPSETDLIQFYQDNPQEFSIPELREIVYTTFNLEHIKSDLRISDEELMEEYEARIQDYQMPPKRLVRQYLFDKEAEAKDAYEKLVAGVEITKESINMGEVVRENLPDEIKDQVFVLKIGEYSKPLKTSLGWHIFISDKEIAKSTLKFEDVKDQINSELVELMAGDAFYKFANEIEDELAAGMTLEEIAKKYDLITHNVAAIDNEGKGISGNFITDIPDRASFLSLIEESELNVESPVTLLPDNSTYLFLRVNNITPTRIRALDEVKGTAIGLWKTDKKAKELKKLSIDIADKLKNGDSLAKLVDDMDLELVKAEVLARPSKNNNDSKYPMALVEELFDLKRGESSLAYRSENGDFLIAQLKTIRKADNFSNDKDNLKSIENELKQSFIQDLREQYSLFLKKQYPVNVNNAMLRAF